jgi:predicted HTH transcriptional regulator
VLTAANRNTIKKHLEALVNNKHLRKNGVGKGTWYTLG